MTMTNWLMAVAVLVIPCYFGVVQVRDLITAARSGQLKCPVRHSSRGNIENVA